jgi:hypothetical protein
VRTLRDRQSILAMPRFIRAMSADLGGARNHTTGVEGGLPVRHRWFTAPVYRAFLDPDGRPVRMRLRRTH